MIKLKMHHFAFVTMMTMQTGLVAAEQLSSEGATVGSTDAPAIELHTLNILPATAAGVQVSEQEVRAQQRQERLERIAATLKSSGSVFAGGL